MVHELRERNGLYNSKVYIWLQLLGTGVGKLTNTICRREGVCVCDVGKPCEVNSDRNEFCNAMNLTVGLNSKCNDRRLCSRLCLAPPTANFLTPPARSHWKPPLEVCCSWLNYRCGGNCRVPSVPPTPSVLLQFEEA